MIVLTRLPRSGRGLLYDSRALLQCLALINAAALRESPLVPLYRSGVVYRDEPDNGYEEWSNPWDTLARGWGDCDDLCIWRCAELIAGTIGAPPEGAKIQTMRRLGTSRFHARIRRANGAEEDPSLILLPR